MPHLPPFSNPLAESDDLNFKVTLLDLGLSQALAPLFSRLLCSLSWLSHHCLSNSTLSPYELHIQAFHSMVSPANSTSATCKPCDLGWII